MHTVFLALLASATSVATGDQSLNPTRNQVEADEAVRVQEPCRNGDSLSCRQVWTIILNFMIWSCSESLVTLFFWIRSRARRNSCSKIRQTSTWIRWPIHQDMWIWMTNWTGIAFMTLSVGLVWFGTNTFHIAPFAHHLCKYSFTLLLLYEKK